MLFAFAGCTMDGTGISGMLGSDLATEDSGYSNAQTDNFIGNLQMALTALIDENSSSIAQLQEEFDSELSGLDTKDKALAKDIEKLKKEYDEKIADLEAKILAFETSANTNTADVAALRAEYEAKIIELEGRITACEEEKSEAGVDYSEEIAALETEIATVKADIATVKADIATVQSTCGARIAALEASAGTLIDLDTTLAEAGKAADAKAVGDAIININTSAAKFTDILEPKAIYG